MEQIKCKYCGHTANCYTETVLASNPPVYAVHCPHCGETYYIFCKDLEKEKVK